MKSNKYWVFNTESIKLLLRRSVYHSVLYATTASLPIVIVFSMFGNFIEYIHRTDLLAPKEPPVYGKEMNDNITP